MTSQALKRQNAPPQNPKPTTKSIMKSAQSLANHFLIPSPSMDDERFCQALIYICRHTHEGAWGFIINQPLRVGSVGVVLHELGFVSSQKAMNIPTLHGGFIRPEAGFVIHTGLPNFDASFAIGENVCLTTSRDILRCISQETLRHYLLCMGFCQWGKGQLESELRQGDWLVCPCDLQILFGADFQDRLTLAHQKLDLSSEGVLPIMGRA